MTSYTNVTTYNQRVMCVPYLVSLMDDLTPRAALTGFDGLICNYRWVEVVNQAIFIELYKSNIIIIIDRQ